MPSIPGNVLWLSLCLPWLLQGALVAELDRSDVIRGERVTLSLRFEAEKFRYPKIGRLCGVPILYHRSADAGAADAESPRRRYVLQYVFAPQTDCTVQPMTMRIDERNETAQPLAVTVRSAKTVPNPEFDFAVTVSKEQVYIGEPFVVTYTFFKRHDHDGIDFDYVAPRLQHIWIKEEQRARALERGDYTLMRYRYVMAAQRSGRLTIPSAAMKVAKRAYKRDPWGQWMPEIEWREYDAEPVTLDVNPLPDNVSLIGDFSLSSRVDRNITDAGEPVTLTVAVRGSGNFEDLAPFEPVIPGVTLFDGDLITEDYLEQGVYKGGWLQKTTMVAEANYTVPAFTLTFFDPDTSQVRRLSTDPIPITVKGAPKPRVVKQLPKEHPKGDIMPYETGVPLFILIGFILGVGATLLLRRIRLRNRKRRNDDLRQALVTLLRHLDDPDARQSAEAVEKHLYEGETGPDKKALREVLRKLDG